MEQEKKIGVLSTAFILAGTTLTANNISTGASIGMGNSFKNAIIAIIIGYVCLTLIWTLTSCIGVKERLNSADILQHIFGTQGYKIPSIILSFCLPFWAVFDTVYVGGIFSAWMPEHPVIGFFIGAVILYGITVLGAIKGVESIKYVCNVMAPIAVVMFVIVIINTVKAAGGMDVVTSYMPESEMGLPMAINLYISSFLTLALFTSDITVDSKNLKAVIIGMPLAMIILPVMFVMGIVGAVGLNCFGVIELANQLGGMLMILCHIFTILCSGTTVPTNCHIYTTQISTITKKQKNIFIILIPIAVLFLGYVVQFKSSLTIISTWVNFVGILFAPAVAIMLAHYYIVLKRDLKNGKSLNEMPKFAKSQTIALAIGFVIGVLLSYFITGLPTVIIQVILTGIVYLILAKAFGEWTK